MDVYLIRHGESEANQNGTHSGWSPVPLTPKGRAQAEAARERLRGLSFDRLFVSDVLRAQQTADILFPGMPRTYTALAREMNNTRMAGLTKEEMYARKGEAYLACRDAFDYSPLGMDCESILHLAGRARAFLEYLSSLSDARRVAVVSHAGFIMAAAACVLGLPPHPKKLLCENASVCVLRLDARGWRVRTWNLPPDLA